MKISRMRRGGGIPLLLICGLMFLGLLISCQNPQTSSGGDPTVLGSTRKPGDIVYEGSKAIGVVFWVDASNSNNYKIVALKDAGKLDWSPSNYYYDFSATNSLTDGKVNHNAIKAACATKGWTYNATSFPAMYSCEYWDASTNAVGSNATGWYLPAKDELNAIYLANKAINTALAKITGAEQLKLGTSYYWSSSQGGFNASYSWFQGFNYGFQYDYVRGNAYYVRAVRAFTSSTSLALSTSLPVIAPKSGMAPMTTAINYMDYSGTVSWGGDLVNGNFATGKVYTATVNLTAKAGYTFTGLTETAFSAANASSVKITANTGSTCTVLITYPITILEVGDIVYEGTKAIGVVFWVDASNSNNYKIVALKDAGKLNWSPSTYYYDFSANSSLTDGKLNHAAIKAACATKGWTYNATSFPAMYSCEYWDASTNAVGSNATGWYLPAKDELNAIYLARNTINTALAKITGAEQLETGYYWSSSQGGSYDYYSCFKNFNDGVQYDYFRDSSSNVRAVRAFNP